MAQEYRTVEYQGQRAERQGYIQAASGQSALDSNADFQQRQLTSAQQSVERMNQAALQNNQRLDQLSLENQRLVAGQMSARNDAVLKNDQLFGEQRLQNKKLQDTWGEEIRQLQLTHSARRDEIKLALSSQQNEALTALGQTIAQFSTTLWKTKADQINKKNQEIQALGQMDELLGLGSTTVQDLARVDQSQYTRLARQGESLLLAGQLDKEGRPMDAARIRSDNPYYLYGRQEGQVLKAVGGLESALSDAVLKAKMDGTIKMGDPNFDVARAQVIHDASMKYIIDNGLTNVPAPILAKYFGSAFIEAQAKVSRQLGSENRQFVLESMKQLGLGQANLSFDAVGSNPAEADKIVSQVKQMSGLDFRQGLQDLLRSYSRQAEMSGNRAPVDNLMRNPDMQFLQGDYAAWQQQWQETAARNADKANKEYADRINGSFLAELAQAKPADVPALRQRYLELAQTLPIDLAGPLMERIGKTTIADATSLRNSLDAVIELTSPAELPAAIQRWKQENPLAPNSLLQEADKALKSFEKALSPDAQQALDEAKNLVLGTIDPKASALRKLNPTADQQVNAILRQRQSELERRSKAYWQRPGASVDGYRNWLQNNNADLIKKPIAPDGNGNFPELGQLAKPSPTSSAAPVPVTAHRNRQVTFFVTQSERNKLLQGQYGRVNATKAIVLTPNEVAAGANSYESGSGHLPLVRQLAARVGMTPEALLMTQAALHGMSGRLVPPKDPRQTPSYQQGTNNGQVVTPQYARSFALSAGLSDRGATWFSTIIRDESGGNPNALHDRDAQGNPTGFGLFGHRLGRRDALIAYAQQRGMPPSDIQTQMEFAVSEIKSKYPDVWNTIRAQNPTTNQLWTAMVKWLGFDQKVYSQRYNSLVNALGGQ